MTELPPAGDASASKQRVIACAQQGLLKHAISIKQGGHGDGFSDLVTAHQLLGKSCLDTGLILSLNAHLWGAVFPLLNYGNEQQKSDYLSQLLEGELIAGHAITEPQAGSDLNGLLMRAEKTTEGFVLNGHKRFITNTPIADLLVIYAKLEEKLCAFIIHADDIGAQFLAQPDVSGCKKATMGDVILENCQIPLARQLGKTGAGNIMIQQALELERAFIFAGFCGVMEWQLKTVIQFSRQRRVNGSHLGKNQAISHKIAEMKVRLDTIQLWVNQCAYLKDNGKRMTMVSAQTKLFSAEAFLQSSLDAVQIMGSEGLVENSLLEMLVSDALASRLFSGSSEIQKNIIAALLGTGEGYK
ncbi:MAG: acyl-CoA dehydrogenase family protein [Methylococcales bacterium]|nr:acyl-CoA dehydrogenase family protein [Methylococcales bacterium]